MTAEAPLAMRLLRTVAAIVIGIGFVALSRNVASSMPYLGASLGVSAFGALMGGWLTARTAPFAPFRHAIGLAAIIATLSIAAVVTAPASAVSVWIAGVVAFVDVTGVLLGGWLRASAAATPPAGGVIV